MKIRSARMSLITLIAATPIVFLATPATASGSGGACHMNDSTPGMGTAMANLVGVTTGSQGQGMSGMNNMMGMVGMTAAMDRTC